MVAHSLYLAPLLPVFWWEDCTLLFPLPHLYTTFIIFNCCSDIVKVGDSRKKLDSIVLCYRRLWVECHCNCSSNHKVCAEVCYHKVCDNIRPWNLSSHLTTHATDFYAYYLYLIMCNTATHSTTEAMGIPVWEQCVRVGPLNILVELTRKSVRVEADFEAELTLKFVRDCLILLEHANPYEWNN